ncbi:MAG: aldo/keto reductase [Myxococcales bacterium]|nr:aldo/keto reductase [Myxococcales bacterium]
MKRDDDNNNSRDTTAPRRADKSLSRRQLLGLGTATASAALLGQATGSGLLGPLPAAAEALPQVPRRTLGKTGKKIPILLLGGAVGFDRRFDPKIAEALRFGVNYIDAADCYNGGSCEPAVASFHKRAKARDKLWITTKSDAHDPEGFRQTVETSLKKLETNYIDMEYLHALEDGKYLSAGLKHVVDKLKAEKKIRHFGFSCHGSNVPELLQLAAKTPWVESVMFRYNFRKYDDRALNAAMDAAHKAGVGLIAMKTQGSEASFESAWKGFTKQGKWSKHQAVLKAVWADERITAVVSHMDSFEKLRQNIAAAVDKSELTGAEWRSLERYASATRALACDGCDHLCGAALPQGSEVRIGDTLRLLMYHDVYREPAKARELFGRLPEGARRLKEVDFGPAAAACPHGVDLAAHMKRALKVLA